MVCLLQVFPEICDNNHDSQLSVKPSLNDVTFMQDF